MLDARQDVLDFLLTRQSTPASCLSGPSPSRDQLQILLKAAARSPDHGALTPWRFLVHNAAACQRLAALVEDLGTASDRDSAKVAKMAHLFRNAPMIVTVVCDPKPHYAIPELEQTLSAGAVCLALLNASLASGWGAVWLSGWPAFDADFRANGLDLGATEAVAGFIHIGTANAVPLGRTRPDVTALTTWVTA